VLGALFANFLYTPSGVSESASSFRETGITFETFA